MDSELEILAVWLKKQKKILQCPGNLWDQHHVFRDQRECFSDDADSVWNVNITSKQILYHVKRERCDKSINY